MTNNDTLKKMVNTYNELSFTHNYIMGWAENGLVWAVKVDGTMILQLVKLDRASRGAGNSIRFKPDVLQKAILHKLDAEIIGTVEEFNKAVENSKYNRGEIFEKWITERAGQNWEKDNVPFTDDGDLTVNGTAYQIKFEKATFTNEKSLARLTSK